MSFDNQVAIVTGASSGIGRELAKVLASQGCQVGLVARRRERLNTLSEEIKQKGGIAFAAAADIGDKKQAELAFREISAQLGPVDLLIANAGVGMPTLLDPVNTPDVEVMFRVNVLGVVNAIGAVLPNMLQRGRGHLVAISSLASFKGLPGEAAYCSSKAAVNVFMEGLRIPLRKQGKAVTTICPGFVRTPMTEANEFFMPWLMEPDEAAQRIVKAIHRRPLVYNFPWQTTLLMRMSRWLPDWAVTLLMKSYHENPPKPPVEAASPLPERTKSGVK